MQRILQMAGSVFRWEPYYVSKYRHRAMAHALGALTRAENFDIVQLEFAFLGPYASACRSGAIVLHEHDVSYRPAYRRYRRAASFLQRLPAYIEWCRWYRYESRLVRACHHVLTVTEQDRHLLEWLTGSTRISYLPRGMDMPALLPPFHSRHPETLLFIGTFQHHPNADAASWLIQEIFPLIVRRHPRATLHIVGADPPSSFREMASRWPGVRVHGFVPDVDQYLDTCSVFLAPLRFGGGVKIKVLHAMAHCMPVVTTKVGIEGIEGFQPGMARLGGTAEELARHVSALFGDMAQAEAMAAAARANVERTFSWSALQNRVEDIYRRAASGPRETRAGNNRTEGQPA
jgi:glycosyltransferase involved in cell wall biosynthesis